MPFTGFKNVAFKSSVVSKDGFTYYRGRTIRYEDGRRLWQKTSDINRLSRGDALQDAQAMAREYIINSI